MTKNLLITAILILLLAVIGLTTYVIKKNNEANKPRIEDTIGIYMNIDDLSIKGDVASPGYENWIKITDLNLGASRYVASPSKWDNDGDGTKKVKINFNEIQFAKLLDSSSSALTKSVLNSDPEYSTSVEIHVVDLKKDKQKATIIYKFEGAKIGNYNIGIYSYADPAPLESYSLAFDSINIEYNGNKNNIGSIQYKQQGE